MILLAFFAQAHAKELAVKRNLKQMSTPMPVERARRMTDARAHTAAGRDCVTPVMASLSGSYG